MSDQPGKARAERILDRAGYGTSITPGNPGGFQRRETDYNPVTDEGAGQDRAEQLRRFHRPEDMSAPPTRGAENEMEQVPWGVPDAAAQKVERKR